MIVHSLVRGSTVANYSVQVDSVQQKDPGGSFSKAVLKLATDGSLNITKPVPILSQQIGNAMGTLTVATLIQCFLTSEKTLEVIIFKKINNNK